MIKQFNPRLLAVVAVLAILLTLTLAIFPSSTLAVSRGGEQLRAPAPGWYTCTYLVRRGDTLFSIAARFGVNVFALAYANGLYNPNFIYAGMVLRIPCPNVPPPQPPPPPPPTNVCAYYIVRPGDFLLLIGARFGVPWQVLAGFNRIYNPNLIYVGMRLAIPCPPNQQPPPQKTRTPQPTRTPTVGAPLTGGFCQPGEFSGAIMVNMQNNKYNPATCKIHKGQTVIWRNLDAVDHTVTQGSCPGGTCMKLTGGFDSSPTPMQNIHSGGTYNLTFNSTGTFSYYCKIHGAAMTGQIQVVP